MSIETIGAVISRLRKENHITQDELAKAVGVSAQAVSKWENGGVPDIELLPRIADYFKVSIDTLFGRNITDYTDVENALAKKISKTEHTDRYNTMLELCWIMEKALMGSTPENGGRISDYESRMEKTEQQYSRVLSDRGFTLMGIGNRLKYFLLVPEIEDKELALFNGIDYPALFKDLSDKTVFDTLVMLNKRPCDKSFTPHLLVKNLGLEYDKATEIINILHKHGLIRTMQIEMDDTTQEVYNFVPTPSFPAMLIFAREMIDIPNCFSYYSGGRNKPYLK